MHEQLDLARKWGTLIAEQVNPELANDFMDWVRALVSAVELETRKAHIKAEEWAKVSLLSQMMATMAIRMEIGNNGELSPSPEVLSVVAHALYKAAQEEAKHA